MTGNGRNINSGQYTTDPTAACELTSVFYSFPGNVSGTCELIVEWFRTEQTVAKGQVYPSRDGMLHGLPIEQGYVKIEEPMPSQAPLIGHGHHQMEFWVDKRTGGVCLSIGSKALQSLELMIGDIGIIFQPMNQ
ncbi:hypothetical protein Tco_0912045, partial [Tanacetum coccineum]